MKNDFNIKDFNSDIYNPEDGVNFSQVVEGTIGGVDYSVRVLQFGQYKFYIPKDFICMTSYKDKKGYHDSFIGHPTIGIPNIVYKDNRKPAKNYTLQIINLNPKIIYTGTDETNDDSFKPRILCDIYYRDEYRKYDKIIASSCASIFIEFENRKLSGYWAECYFNNIIEDGKFKYNEPLQTFSFPIDKKEIVIE